MYSSLNFDALGPKLYARL